MQLTKVSINDVQMVLGTMVRPRDPAEDKYARALSAPPLKLANLNEEVSLVRPGFDPRPPIFNQGGMGSCAAVSTCMATYAARNIARKSSGQAQDALLFNPAPVYYEARRKHGWQGQDTGSYIADNCDLLLQDAPLLTPSKPYSDDFRKLWNVHAWDDDGVYDYEKSHQPFYDGLLENIWLALKQGLPVVLGAYWANEFFHPQGGRLPAGVNFNPNVGGHAFYAWGYTPGFVLCDNSWSERWSVDASVFGHQMRPGSFAIPAEYFQPKRNVFEARVISPEPVVAPQPEPKPEPQPEPQPQPKDCTAAKVRLIAAATRVKEGFVAPKKATEYAKTKSKHQTEAIQAAINEMHKVIV